MGYSHRKRNKPRNNALYKVFFTNTIKLRNLKGICYLDHAGSALYTDSQINTAMKDLKTHLYRNPHSSGGTLASCEELINNIRFKYVITNKS